MNPYFFSYTRSIVVWEVPVIYYLCSMDDFFVNIHTHSRTGEGIEVVSAMALSDALPERPCSMGIHPYNADMSPKTLEKALRQVETAQVDAIGEIGLDYARPVANELQARIFEDQLAIARQRKLPVIIHCVRAFEPTLALLIKYGVSSRAVFHGFIGSRQQAAHAVEEGCYLSFGVRSFASPRTVDAMLSVPLSKLFLETDDTDISIRQVYAEAARMISGTDVAALKKITYDNYKELFGL